MLFLSRIHQKKGCLNLVQAWQIVRPAGWKMVIAGPNEDGHQQIVEAAIHQAGLQDAFTFTGSVYGDEKEALYRSADLFVCPPSAKTSGWSWPKRWPVAFRSSPPKAHRGKACTPTAAAGGSISASNRWRPPCAKPRTCRPIPCATWANGAGPMSSRISAGPASPNKWSRSIAGCWGRANGPIASASTEGKEPR